MRSMPRNLVKETLCDVFTTGYCAAADGIKSSFLSFMESLVTEMMHRRALNEKHNQTLVRNVSDREQRLKLGVSTVVHDQTHLCRH